MATTRGQGIRQRAIAELENLSLSLDEELEITANLTIAEIDDELRELDVDPCRLPSVSLDQLLSEKPQSKSQIYFHLLDDLPDDEIATPVIVFGLNSSRLLDK